MRKNSAEARKIQNGEHFLRTMLFNSVRIYALSVYGCFIFPTDSKNIKERALQRKRVVSLGAPGPLFASIASAVKQIRLQRSLTRQAFIRTEQCVTLYLLGIEQTTVYVDIYTPLVQIEDDYFFVAKNDRFLKILNEIIDEKLGE